jgi:hypothetical protein
LRSEAKVVATVFALSAFAVAVVAGLSSGNQTSTVLLRAIVCMIACQILGLIAGSIIERVLVEHEARYHKAHPVPALKSDSADVPIVDEAVDETEHEQRAAA